MQIPVFFTPIYLPQKSFIMKSIFIYFCLAFTNLAAFSQHSICELEVFNDDNKRFAVVIDNHVYTSHNQNSITVLGLQPGRHAMRVVEYAYDANINKTRKRLIYQGFVSLLGQTRYEYIITLRNELQLEDMYALQPNCSPTFDPYFDEPNTHHTPYNHCLAPIVVALPVCAVMNEYDFNRLMSSVEGTAFDDTRKQLFLAAVANQRLNVAQVSIALQAFAFESTKLEVAKKAYAAVCDKQYYYRLADVFAFASSVDELSAFLQNNN